MKYLREISTTTTDIRLREDGIVETRPSPIWTGTETLEHAKANLQAVAEISEGRMLPTLNFLGDTYVSEEARKHYSSAKPVALASAMITNSFIQKMVGNFFMKFNRLQIPLRLFTKEEEAVAWLLKQKEKQALVGSDSHFN